MKIRLVALLTTLSIVCLPMQSYAAKGGEKGPSDRAYERASDNASFKREDGKPGKAEHRRDNDKGSKDKGSKDKGSKDKGSKDKGSKDKGS
jgi:hypothetical protein